MKEFALSLLFALLVIVFALIFLPVEEAARGIADSIRQAWSGIPLTNHAQVSHAEQTWNAATIQERLDCTPSDQIKHGSIGEEVEIVCTEVKPGLSIGLMIGRAVCQVITGFAARSSYWNSFCQ